MKAKRVSNPTNVRFDDETKNLLVEVASKYGVSASDIIRFAVRDKLPQWLNSNVVLTPRRVQPI